MSEVFWAAFGGGLASLISVGMVEFARWFADRPLLKVSLERGFLHNGSGQPRMPQLLFEARNPHTKSVTVNSFGLVNKDSKADVIFIVPQAGFQFPYEIRGGCCLTQWTDERELVGMLRSRGEKPSDLKWAWFKSSVGTTFKGRISKRTMTNLGKAFCEIREAANPA